MSTVTATKKREGVGREGRGTGRGMLQQRVHILFSYLCLVFVKKTFYSAPAAKVSISAIVKFLHAQQIKMSTHTQAHTHLWTSYHTIHAMWMTSVSCCCLPSLSLPSLLPPTEDSNRLKSTTMCTRWNARHDDGKWGWQLWLDDDDDVATWRDSMRRQLVSQIHTHTHTRQMAAGQIKLGISATPSVC